MSYDSHGSFRLLVWASPFSALGMSVSVCLWQDTLKTPLQPVSSCLMVNLNLNVWLIIRPNPLPWQPDSCSSKINIISMESDNINSSWVLRSCWTAVCSGHSHCLSPSVFQPHTIYTLPFCLIESFLKKNLYLEVRVWLNHTSLFHFSNFFFFFFFLHFFLSLSSKKWRSDIFGKTLGSSALSLEIKYIIKMPNYTGVAF